MFQTVHLNFCVNLTRDKFILENNSNIM